MPISRARAAKHIADWGVRAGKPYWPKYLFHAAHVSAVSAALSNGKLICRQKQHLLVHDVANPGAIASNADALKYVRLYFRPKTYFHLRTEGVKFRGDQNRQGNEMSIPVMLMFDFTKTIIQQGVGFSHGKLAHAWAKPGFDEAFFDSIPFADVYHDGAPPQARQVEVNERRMSEVVVPDQLSLDENLKFIACRTIYDEMTLRYLAAGSSSSLLSRIITPDPPSDLFFCWGTFIQLLEFQGDVLRMKLYPGVKYKGGQKVQCRVEQHVGQGFVASSDFEEEINKNSVEIGPFLKKPASVWKIWLEGVLAFHGTLPYGVSQLVKA